MSESNPFTFFSSPSFSPAGQFSFSAGTSNGHSSAGSRPAKNRVWQVNRKSCTSNHPQNASTLHEKGNEDNSSTKSPHEDQKPETAFTTPSAMTGAIPCHFEGSTYYFKSNCFTTEESIKKEEQDKSESKSPSTQMVVVSRILKGIPQNPHFLPLKTYSNVAKQRLINAWDNIFEETVDKLLSAQINGFSGNAERLWETMEELEKMGYNVLHLRRRLVELTDVALSRRRHRTEMTRFKVEAEKHRMEKSRLEFEIVKLKAKVEAEKASVKDMMARVAKMEDELPHFNADFTKLAIKLF